MVGDIIGCDPTGYSDPGDSDGGDSVSEFREGFDQAWRRRYSHQTQTEHEGQSNFSSLWHLKVPDYRQRQQDNAKVNHGVDEACSHSGVDE